MAFNNWPWVDLQNLNLDWILRKTKQAEEAAETVETYDTRLSAVETVASNALSTANTAISTANSAISDSASALSYAQTAHVNASVADANATQAVTTANTASSNASTALSTAQQALTLAQNAASFVNIEIGPTGHAFVGDNPSDIVTGEDVLELINPDDGIIPTIIDNELRYYWYIATDHTHSGDNIRFVSFDVDSSEIIVAVLPYSDSEFTFTRESVGGGGTTLPSHTATDAGKVLSINSLNNLVWSLFYSLPQYDQNDEDKIVQIYNGYPEWVMPAFIKYVAQSLTDPQKAQARTNIGASAETIRETVSGTTATIDAEVDTLYLCGTMTALTIDTFPATGIFSVVFTSGSTATTLTVPNTLIMPDGFTVEANKRYEINVLDGYAVVAEWGVTP